MLNKIIAKLQEKKLYEIILAIVAFLSILLLEKIFNIGVSLLLTTVFIVARLILKRKLQETNPLMLNALNLQITHYSLILIVALQQPITFVIELMIIFWGIFRLYKKPSWISGGVMMVYNAIYLVTYILGISQAIAINDITNLRKAVFGFVISGLSIMLILLAVKAVKRKK